jgi:hypothetical protein
LKFLKRTKRFYRYTDTCLDETGARVPQAMGDCYISAHVVHADRESPAQRVRVLFEILPDTEE